MKFAGQAFNNYTVSQKTDTDVAHYNFSTRQPILVTFSGQ